MINYREWAEEYKASAKQINKTMQKYKRLIDTNNQINREKYNSIVSNYRSIYNNLLHTAAVLENKAQTIEIREELHQQMVNEVKLCAKRLQSKT